MGKIPFKHWHSDTEFLRIKPDTICVILLTVLFCLGACTNDGRKVSGNEKTEQKPKESEQIAAAQKWLVSSLETHFNEGPDRDYAYLCTPQYAEFKRDATNVDLDPGMSEAAFRKKWGRRCSPYAGINTGFMIAGQDYGKIRVRSCRYSHKTEMGHYLFELVIDDIDFGSVYYRDVVLKPENNTFLIDNVLERRNEFAIP